MAFAWKGKYDLERGNGKQMERTVLIMTWKKRRWAWENKRDFWKSLRSSTDGVICFQRSLETVMDWLTCHSFPSCGSPEAGGDIQCRPPGCYHHHLHWVSADAIAGGVGWNYPEIHQQPEGKEEWGACGWYHWSQCPPEKQKQGHWDCVHTTGLERNTFWTHVYVYSVNIIKFSHHLYTQTTVLTLNLHKSYVK